MRTRKRRNHSQTETDLHDPQEQDSGRDLDYEAGRDDPLDDEDFRDSHESGEPRDESRDENRETD